MKKLIFEVVFFFTSLPFNSQNSQQVEVQMFQLYRDGLDDLLKEPIKRKKGDDEDNNKKPPPLKITLAEHSPTGLVYVRISTRF